MVVCLDGGPAYELKWCPLPSHDSVSHKAYFFHNREAHLYYFPFCQYNDQIRPRKLGLLGGTFEDGSLSVYAIPDPADVKSQNHGNSQPIFGTNVLPVRKHNCNGHWLSKVARTVDSNRAGRNVLPDV